MPTSKPPSANAALDARMLLEKQKAQQEIYAAYPSHRWPAGAIASLGGGGGGGAGGVLGGAVYSSGIPSYQPNQVGGYVGVSGLSSDAKSVVDELIVQNRALNKKVADLERALRNPDLPLATSVNELVKNIDMSTVARRTVPPFNENNLSHHLAEGDGLISDGTYGVPLRDGSMTTIRVVGLIVREETNHQYMNTFGMKPKPDTAYVVPTRKLTEGDALEAISDLISEIVMKRVLKNMEEDND